MNCQRFWIFWYRQQGVPVDGYKYIRLLALVCVVVGIISLVSNVIATFYLSNFHPGAWWATMIIIAAGAITMLSSYSGVATLACIIGIFGSILGIIGTIIDGLSFEFIKNIKACVDPHYSPYGSDSYVEAAKQCYYADYTVSADCYCVAGSGSCHLFTGESNCGSIMGFYHNLLIVSVSFDVLACILVILLSIVLCLAVGFPVYFDSLLNPPPKLLSNKDDDGSDSSDVSYPFEDYEDDIDHNDELGDEENTLNIRMKVNPAKSAHYLYNSPSSYSVASSTKSGFNSPQQRRSPNRTASATNVHSSLTVGVLKRIPSGVVRSPNNESSHNLVGSGNHTSSRIETPYDTDPNRPFVPAEKYTRENSASRSDLTLYARRKREQGGQHWQPTSPLLDVALNQIEEGVMNLTGYEPGHEILRVVQPSSKVHELMAAQHAPSAPSRTAAPRVDTKLGTGFQKPRPIVLNIPSEGSDEEISVQISVSRRSSKEPREKKP